MNKKKYRRFSSRMGVAAVGLWMGKQAIWQEVERRVQIRQKTVRHKPIDKLMDAFVNIIAGGERMVEVNTRVRPDQGLQRAFGRRGCAEQSGVSTTLNRCQAENVAQMQAALAAVYRRHSQGYRHGYRHWQVLDVDMSGLEAGRQAEGSTKGYFSKRRSARGRQVGRVIASRYDEIVYQQLYPGKVQLDQSLQELVTAASQILELDQIRRGHTVVRVDGGGGRDADINWLLGQGYGLLAKAHNWQRCRKLAATVTAWQADTQEVGRQAGWVTLPHPFDQPTRQAVVRKRKPDGRWQLSLLITNLPTEALAELAGRKRPGQPDTDESLWAIVYAYDKRSGGIESSLRQSKEGLHLHQRNKHRFFAQEMLLLLAQLAQNVLIWARRRLARTVKAWHSLGIKRLLRDVLLLPGYLQFDRRGRLRGCVFDQYQPSAAAFLRAAALGLLDDDLSLHLRKI